LFEEQGYEATTIEEIAALADVSTTTFFRYFPSKAEVLVADHGQHFRRCIGRSSSGRGLPRSIPRDGTQGTRRCVV
jgi:AcrR family transcriptional regulator